MVDIHIFAGTSSIPLQVSPEEFVMLIALALSALIKMSWLYNPRLWSSPSLHFANNDHQLEVCSKHPVLQNLFFFSERFMSSNPLPAPRVCPPWPPWLARASCNASSALIWNLTVLYLVSLLKFYLRKICSNGMYFPIWKTIGSSIWWPDSLTFK